MNKFKLFILILLSQNINCMDKYKLGIKPPSDTFIYYYPTYGIGLHLAFMYKFSEKKLKMAPVYLTGLYVTKKINEYFLPILAKSKLHELKGDSKKDAWLPKSKCG